MTHTAEKIHFEAPRGMRDFYPDSMDVRNAVFNAWTQAARQFGFSQYDACVVESLELLKHKSGDDIIDQIYAFQDKKQRHLALRPEMTPTLARMIAARQSTLLFPLKWFTIAQCFRYERMSRGRKREHYQWNLDIVGEPDLSAEVELIVCAVHALSLLGLESEDIIVHFSNRALISDLLLKLGVPARFHNATFLTIDKRGKLDDDAITRLLKDSGLDQPSIDTVFRIAGIQSIEEAESMLDGKPPSIQAIQTMMNLLSEYGISDKTMFDITVVRGLAYYTGIIFEAFDAEKKFRAIFGGGRYDNLLQDVGGTPMTAVGLGFGDVVLTEILAEKEKITLHHEKIDLAIGYMENDQQAISIQIAKSMRGTGKRVDLALHCEKAKHFFARVGKGKILQAIFLGPDDIQRGTVRIKNLSDRTESETQLDQLVHSR